MKRADAAFTALTLVAAVGAFVWALQWPFRSQFFVLVVSVPLAVLTACQLALAIRAWGRTGAHAKRGMDLRLGGSLPPEVVARRGLAFTGWVVGFGVALWLLGFVAGGLLMVVLYMAIAMRERLGAIAGMVVSLGLVFFLMRTVLHIPLPRSALLQMLGT